MDEGTAVIEFFGMPDAYVPAELLVKARGGVYIRLVFQHVVRSAEVANHHSVCVQESLW